MAGRRPPQIVAFVGGGSVVSMLGAWRAHGVVTSRPGRRGWHVRACDDGTVVEEPLDAEPLGAPAPARLPAAAA